MADPIIIDRNITDQTDLINSLDMDVPGVIQPFLNKLYSGEYSTFWTQTFWDVPLGNFFAAILVFLFFLLLRKFFTNIILGFLTILARKSETRIDDRIIEGLKGPIRFSFIIIGTHLFFLLIFKENHFIKMVLESLAIFTIFWALISLVEAFKEFLVRYSDDNSHLSKELSSFLVRLIKAVIFAIGFSTILYNWGINVTALIASLGLGGLAFALAAKDTAANLFGSIALLLDNSIKIGEWIKVGGVEGVVEDVGMRTTKIRSFQKSLITVPNHIVANNPIENFSRRGIRRIKMKIGLTYDTNSKQIENIIQDIKGMLQSHPGISHKETLLVNFDTFDDSSLGLFIYAFAHTAKWDQYLEIREDINIRIMHIVEKNGSGFAFPSQSLYVEKLPSENVL
ncbi:MAG: mechanosensitive ion channel family protein [Campylobacterota bacterium]|nr:mechanosensitive ion channel family protein [Campylobacterota bacterium]